MGKFRHSVQKSEVGLVPRSHSPSGVALLMSTPSKSMMLTRVEGRPGFSRQEVRTWAAARSVIWRKNRRSLSLFPASMAPRTLQRLQGIVTTNSQKMRKLDINSRSSILQATTVFCKLLRNTEKNCVMEWKSYQFDPPCPSRPCSRLN